MPTPWKALLGDTPVQWREDEGVHAFSRLDLEIAQAVDGDVVCPLPSTAVIEVSGADAAGFLQSQLTNDIRALTDGNSQLAGYCNPKGRMLALFRVILRGERYLLLLPRALAPAVLKRLRMFVLRSKVVLSDVSDQWAALGVSGAGAIRRLQECGVTVPEHSDAGSWRGETGVVRLSGQQPRALLLAPAADMASLWPNLVGLPKGGEPAWRLLEIRAGEPQILPGAQENIIPQMANLDLLGGISFTKGCYPGQEIVARMHYLGNLKRRMYRLVIATPEPPAPGADVRDAAGALVGEVVMAAPAPEGQVEALAVLQIERASAADLQVEGHSARALPPPYLSSET
jgi:folate-binding protein YgfZ